MEEDDIRFKLSDRVQTTYYNRFFMLRVPVRVNERTVEISMSNKNVLQLTSRYPKVSVSFDSVITLVDDAVRHHGVSGVCRGWCENEAPVFDLAIRPGDNLSKLLHTKEELHAKLGRKMHALLSQGLVEVDSGVVSLPLSSLSVKTELFMVTPNASNSSVVLVPVTADNLLASLDLWRKSAVFDFGAAFTAHRVEPTRAEDEGMIYAAGNYFSPELFYIQYELLHSIHHPSWLLLI